MSTALAPGAAPGALVPGDPAGARALAERLDTYANSAATAAGQLRALDAGGWVGEAAEAFRQALGQVPERLERAVDAFAEAASALRAYASVLEEAQERAGLALARVEAAEADTAAWRARSAEYATALAAEAGGGPPAGPAPPSHDPGAPGRSAAEALLDAARSDVETAARAAAERLERAAADAPDQPGFWSSAWHAAGQFVAGAAEASLELGELVFKLNPTYALTNPQGFVEHVVGLGQGAVYAATHRTEFAKAVVNWDMWLDNPARALGQLVPDLVLAVGTGGAGAAARGAARGAARLDGLGAAARRGARDLAREETGSMRVPGSGRAIVSGYVKAFDAAGIPYTRHFAERVLGRGSRGVTGEAALSVYRNGSHFFDPKRKNYVRFDRQTGVAVVLRGRMDGPAHTVLVKPNRRPTPRWVPIRHRRE